MSQQHQHGPRSRMTRQRAVILEELRKTTSHPTADELYAMVRRRLAHISLGTVYRNLDLLAESGQILRLDSAGSMRRFDGNAEPHAHVRCVTCGRIGDVYKAPTPDSAALADLHVDDFKILGARVEYDGLCAHCAQSA